MKWILPILVLATVSSAQSAGNPYGWTISASATDPYVNVASPTGGPATFYLWLACSDVPPHSDGTPREQGFSLAEFALIFTGIVHLATATSCISTNVPPSPDFTFLCPGCPGGPIVVAELVVLNLPGTICFAPTIENGVLETTDCELEPTMWGMDWIGMSTQGSAPCSTEPLCQGPVSNEDVSWGQVKALYR